VTPGANQAKSDLRGPEEDHGLTALRLAAAAGAATILLAAAGAAWCDVPKARIQGVNDARLRQEIERAIGTSKNPPQSRFEARRRAESAAADVLAVLRSEGYYEAVIAPDVGEGDQPASVV
jgi:translocation and assembly module TamA